MCLRDFKAPHLRSSLADATAARTIFYMMDTDLDGNVSVSEFARFLTTQHSSFGLVTHAQARAMLRKIKGPRFHNTRYTAVLVYTGIYGMRFRAYQYLSIYTQRTPAASLSPSTPYSHDMVDSPASVLPTLLATAISKPKQRARSPQPPTPLSAHKRAGTLPGPNEFFTPLPARLHNKSNLL